MHRHHERNRPAVEPEGQLLRQAWSTSWVIVLLATVAHAAGSTHSAFLTVGVTVTGSCTVRRSPPNEGAGGVIVTCGSSSNVRVSDSVDATPTGPDTSSAVPKASTPASPATSGVRFVTVNF